MKKEHILYIWPDVDYYLEDEERMCFGATDDSIYNNDNTRPPLFKFTIPGISEWHWRYVRATDFVNAIAAPSFDWRQWHRDGLIFAKEIHSRLPRNYNLIYKRPFEDHSGILEEVIFSTDNVDEVINSLNSVLEQKNARPSFIHNIQFSLGDRLDGLLSVTFTVGNRNHTVLIDKCRDTKYLRQWMERIIANDEEIILAVCFKGETWGIEMIPQQIGQFTEMAQLHIIDSENDVLFSAYVNRREFVRGLYLTLMDHLGFNIYTTEEFQSERYPQGQDRTKRWQPYNELRSDIIEWFITDELFYNNSAPITAGTRQVDETVVMWVDYDCCFWDTMGVGSGDEAGLSLDCGEFEMDIPGLREWKARWASPDSSKSGFEAWWKEGWRLAKEVRKRLPANVDLYYMSYDTQHPDEHLDHKSQLPKIIVPFNANKE